MSGRAPVTADHAVKLWVFLCPAGLVIHTVRVLHFFFSEIALPAKEDQIHFRRCPARIKRCIDHLLCLESLPVRCRIILGLVPRTGEFTYSPNAKKTLKDTGSCGTIVKLHLKLDSVVYRLVALQVAAKVKHDRVHQPEVGSCKGKLQEQLHVL